jgi:GNAT superfamily N-acetyltransferase
MSLVIKNVTPELVADYINFFDSCDVCDDFRGCYCTWYHWNSNYEKSREKLPQDEQSCFKRNLAMELINKNELNGFLAFDDGKVVGWCNADNKQSYDRLMKINIPEIWADCNTDERTLSIVCFLVDKKSRGKGIATSLLKAVIEYAQNNGYQYIEAYPHTGEFNINDDYHGPATMYEKQGFKIVGNSQIGCIARKQL